MINFRASLTGSCLREIVSVGLNPREEEFNPFLMGGHGLQTTVTDFLIANKITIPTSHFKEEFEGKYAYGDRWKLTGHVDGLIYDAGKLSVLEIKALKDENFKKLQDTNNWRGLYSQYIPQIQCYMGFTIYNNPDESAASLIGPTETTHMVFYNRNTGEVLSPYRS